MIKVICIECEKEKKHYAHRMCEGCYRKKRYKKNKSIRDYYKKKTYDWRKNNIERWREINCRAVKKHYHKNDGIKE